MATKRRFKIDVLAVYCMGLTKALGRVRDVWVPSKDSVDDGEEMDRRAFIGTGASKIGGLALVSSVPVGGLILEAFGGDGAEAVFWSDVLSHEVSKQYGPLASVPIKTTYLHQIEKEYQKKNGGSSGVPGEKIYDAVQSVASSVDEKTDPVSFRGQRYGSKFPVGRGDNFLYVLEDNVPEAHKVRLGWVPCGQREVKWTGKWVHPRTPFGGISFSWAKAPSRKWTYNMVWECETPRKTLRRDFTLSFV